MDGIEMFDVTPEDLAPQVDPFAIPQQTDAAPIAEGMLADGLAGNPDSVNKIRQSQTILDMPHTGEVNKEVDLPSIADAKRLTDEAKNVKANGTLTAFTDPLVAKEQAKAFHSYVAMEAAIPIASGGGNEALAIAPSADMETPEDEDVVDNGFTAGLKIGYTSMRKGELGFKSAYEDELTDEEEARLEQHKAVMEGQSELSFTGKVGYGVGQAYELAMHALEGGFIGAASISVLSAATKAVPATAIPSWGITAMSAVGRLLGKVGVLAPEGIAATSAMNTIAAAKFGAKAKAAVAMFKTESDAAYEEMTSEGVDASTAQVGGLLVGFANGVLEYAGVHALLGGGVIQRTVRDRVKSLLAEKSGDVAWLQGRGALVNLGAAYGSGVLVESITEALQEATTATATEIAKKYSTKEIESTFSTENGRAEFVDRILEAASFAAQSSLLVGMVGPGLNYINTKHKWDKMNKQGESIETLHKNYLSLEIESLAPDQREAVLQRMFDSRKQEFVYVHADQLVRLVRQTGMSVEEFASLVSDPADVQEMADNIYASAVSFSQVRLSSVRVFNEVLTHKNFRDVFHKFISFDETIPPMSMVEEQKELLDQAKEELSIQEKQVSEALKERDAVNIALAGKIKESIANPNITDEQKNVLAQHWASVYQAWGEQYGKTAAEMYDAVPYKPSIDRAVSRPKTINNKKAVPDFLDGWDQVAIEKEYDAQYSAREQAIKDLPRMKSLKGLTDEQIAERNSIRAAILESISPEAVKKRKMELIRGFIEDLTGMLFKQKPAEFYDMNAAMKGAMDTVKERVVDRIKKNRSKRVNFTDIEIRMLGEELFPKGMTEEQKQELIDLIEDAKNEIKTQEDMIQNIIDEASTNEGGLREKAIESAKTKAEAAKESLRRFEEMANEKYLREIENEEELAERNAEVAESEENSFYESYNEVYEYAEGFYKEFVKNEMSRIALDEDAGRKEDDGKNKTTNATEAVENSNEEYWPVFEEYVRDFARFYFKNLLITWKSVISDESISNLHQIISDMSVFFQWHGVVDVENLDKMPKEHFEALEERFVSSWLEYLVNGTSASRYSSALFDRFSGFLRRAMSDTSRRHGIRNATPAQQFDALFSESGVRPIGELPQEISQILNRMMFAQDQIERFYSVDEGVEKLEIAEASASIAEKFPDKKLQSEEMINKHISALTTKTLRAFGFIYGTRTRADSKLRHEINKLKRKARAEAEAEFDKTREGKTLKFLLTGEFIGDDGRTRNIGGPAKISALSAMNALNVNGVRNRALFDYLKSLGVLSDTLAPDGIVPSGYSIDYVASMAGYKSAEEMVRSLAIMPDRETTVSAAVERKVAFAFRQFDPKVQERAVKDVVYSDLRLQMAAAHYTALSDITKSLDQYMQEIREEVSASMRNTPVSNFSMANIEKEASENARKANVFIRKGDLNKYLVYKQAEIRALVKRNILQEHNETLGGFLKGFRLLLKKDEVLSKNYNSELIDVARIVWLARGFDELVGLDPNQVGMTIEDIEKKNRVVKGNFVNFNDIFESKRDVLDSAMYKDGVKKVIDEDGNESRIAAVTKAKEMVMSDQLEFAQMIHALIYEAAEMKKIEIEDKKEHVEATVDEVVGQIGAYVNAVQGRTSQLAPIAHAIKQNSVYNAVNSALIKAGLAKPAPIVAGPARSQGTGISSSYINKGFHWFMSSFTNLIRPQDLFERIDGVYYDQQHGYMADYRKAGPLTKIIWEPIKKACARYRTARDIATNAVLKIIDGLDLSDDGVIDLSQMNQLTKAMPEEFRFVTKAQLFSMLLHSGNDSNMRKMLAGRGMHINGTHWASTRTDWTAFLNMQFTNGVLNKSHMDAAQKIWNIHERLLVDVQATHKRLYSYNFKSIPNTPLQTPFGTYQGGYVSIKYTDQAKAQQLIYTNLYTTKSITDIPKGIWTQVPGTGHGFTLSRTAYEGEVSLDPMDVVYSLDSMLRFVHIQVPVKEAFKIVNHDRFVKAMNEVDPEAIRNVIIPAMEAAASQSLNKATSDPRVDKLFTYLRRITGVNTMFLNVVNAAQQATGFGIATTKVSTHFIVDAFNAFIKDSDATMNYIGALSPMMHERRFGAQFEDIAELKQQIEKMTKFDKFQSYAIRNAYILQMLIQIPIDHIVWSAAYNEYMTNAHISGDAQKMLATDLQEAAVEAADAVVRGTQSSLMPEDVSNVERASPFVRLFLQYFNWFNMMWNLLGTQISKAMHGFGPNVNYKLMTHSIFATMFYAVFMSEAIKKMAQQKYDDDDDRDESIKDIFVWAPINFTASMFPMVGAIWSTVYATKAKEDSPFAGKYQPAPGLTQLVDSAVGMYFIGESILGMFKDDEDGEAKNYEIAQVGKLMSTLFGIPTNFFMSRYLYMRSVMEGDKQFTYGGVLVGNQDENAMQNRVDRAIVELSDSVADFMAIDPDNPILESLLSMSESSEEQQ